MSEIKNEEKKLSADEELQLLINKIKGRIYLCWGIFYVAVLLFLVGIVGFAGESDFSKPVAAVLLFGGAVTMIALGVVLYFMYRKKRISFGEKLTKSVLSEVLELKEYKPLGHIEANTIKETQLIGASWNTIEGTDLFKGIYKGVEITCSDVTLKLVVSTGKTTTVIQVFKGQWISLKLGKRLGSKLIVREKDEKIFGGYVKAKSDIQTESMDFNEKYQIKTDNPHEAFYILTPNFMEFLDKTDEFADAKTGFCFVGNEMHIALSNKKDLFEATGKDNDIPGLRKRMREEIAYITKLVDEMIKNEKLFG